MPNFAHAKPPLPPTPKHKGEREKKKVKKKVFNIPLSNPFCLQIWWLAFLDTLKQLPEDNT